MTPRERLEAARTEIARRRVVALAATPGPWCEYGGELWTGRAEDLTAYDTDPDNAYFANHQLFHGDVCETPDAKFIAENHPGHVLAVLHSHLQVLDLTNAWLADRLSTSSPLTDVVNAVLDLYAPVREPADV